MRKARGGRGVPDVYRLGVLWPLSGTLGHPHFGRLTSTARIVAGHSAGRGVLCKQGVGGSSPLVSTIKSEVDRSRRLPGRRVRKAGDPPERRQGTFPVREAYTFGRPDSLKSRP